MVAKQTAKKLSLLHQPKISDYFGYQCIRIQVDLKESLAPSVYKRNGGPIIRNGKIRWHQQLQEVASAVKKHGHYLKGVPIYTHWFPAFDRFHS